MIEQDLDITVAGETFITPTKLYNLRMSLEKDKYQGAHWSKYQPRDNKVKDPNQNVGPGQYDANVKYSFFREGGVPLQNSLKELYVPIYKLKPSPGFASKSLRYMDQRKGMISQKALKSASMRSLSTGQGLSQGRDDLSDSEYEFVEDTVPAPGYYHIGRDQKPSSPPPLKKSHPIITRL